MSTYSAAIIADGPIGYWRLNDSGTTVVDQMGTFTGAFQGTNTKQANGLLYGDNDTALAMAGSGGTVFTTAQTPQLTADWSVECWVKITTLANGKTIVGIANNNSPFPQNFILSNGGYAGGTLTMFALGFGSNNAPQSGFSALFTPAGTVVASQTYHVVGTFTLSTLFWQIFVNGYLSATRTTAVAPPIGQSEQFSMGNNMSGTAGIIGTVDDIAIYNKVLTATQVLNHYLIGTGRQHSGSLLGMV